jgi:hypothetical protein
MSMGFYYTEPKKGDGYSITAPKMGMGSIYISPMTKASALEVKREMVARGIPRESIEIEKN